MPRAFLIKKHSPGKENAGKARPGDDIEPIDSNMDAETMDLASTPECKGPFDLSTKPTKPDEEESEPVKPFCTPGVIEFSPKILTADYKPPYKVPSIIIPSVTRPQPSHIQKPVPTMEPMNLHTDSKPWLFTPPPLVQFGYPFLPSRTFNYPYLGGTALVSPPRMEMPLYPPAGPWGPREGSPSPDSGESCPESAGCKSVVSSSSSPPRYQCSACNKSYATYSGLARHKQFHCVTQVKKAFNCKYCDKVYVSLGALKMHIRTHTLPCKCTLCGKAFSRPWLLQGHIRTHTGEKPFACPNCSRAFADRSNLRAHLQTHSDIKKYSCKACSKTFSRMSLLLKHNDGGCGTIRYGPVAIQNC